MNSEQTSEKQIAISAVLKAGPLCQQVKTDMVAEDAVEKEDKTPVTVKVGGKSFRLKNSIRSVINDQMDIR